MIVNYPVLGIDVSKAKLDVCLLEEGDRRSDLIVPNTSEGFEHVIHFIHERTAAPLTACLEATNVYSAAVAVFLHEHGVTVILANPASVHGFMQAQLRRAKTDTADAASIADFAIAMARKLRAWHPLPAAAEELRDLVRRLHELSHARGRTKNQIEKAGYLSSAAKAAITQSLEADLTHQEKQTRAILKAIRICLKKSTTMTQRFNLLTSAPGIGEVTAVTFMAEVPDIHQFSEAKQLAAFAGVTPRIRHSGTRTPVSQPISKMGSARLRQALYMSSLTAKRYNRPISHFAKRLRDEGKKPMVVNIAVVRKLLHQLYAIEKYQRPYDPNYQIPQLAAGTN